MTTEFRQGYLKGSSRVSGDIGSIASGEFDFMVLASSWDRRCMSITGATSLHAKTALVLLFTGKDKKGLREKHDPLLLEFARRNAKSVFPVKGDSVELTQVWRQLCSQLQQSCRYRAAPLRLFIDLSVCPRYYALGLVATCLRSGLAETVTLSYAEGRYPESPQQGDDQELFTAGGWKPVNVPELSGKWDPNKKRFYLVAVGFEGNKTLRLVSRAEPDRVSLLFPDPGSHREYVARTESENRELIRTLLIPEDQIIRAPAGDAIAAWQALSSRQVERVTTENTYYVCCGTKPHCLALALRALALEYPAVLYIVPDSHKPVDVEPTGKFWRFDIQDITALPAGKREDRR